MPNTRIRTIFGWRAARHGALLLIGLWAGSVLAYSCSVISSGIVFGAYQPLTFAGKLNSTDKTSTATVSVLCDGISVATGSKNYTISLGASSHGAGDHISTRYMQRVGGSELMAFNIFTDAGHTIVWGGSTVLSGTIVGKTNHDFTVYGRIPAGQTTLKAGSYSDSITMTLTYTP